MKKSILVTLLLSAAFMVTSCGGPSAQPSDDSVVPGSDSGQPSESQPDVSSSEETVTVTLDKEVMSVGINETVQLKATSNLGGAAFQWSSSKADVASVDQLGNVKGLKEGETVITAQIVGREEKAICKVTVVGDYFIEEDTEILVQTTFNDTFGQIFKDAVTSLAKKEPHLTVKYDKYSGGYSDLKDEVVKGIPAGNYADIVAAYPDSVADFINAGVPLKMDKYMNNEDYGWTAEEKADFYDAYIQEGQNYSIPGTYSLPIAKSTEAMYYDSDKIIGLNLAGIDPTINGGNAINEEYLNNLTWDELFNKFCPALLEYRETLPSDAAKKAFLDTETEAGWAIVGYDSDDNLFITLAEQYGYGYTSMNQTTGAGRIEFDNDGMKGLMKQFNAAYKAKYFTTKGVVGKNVNYLSNADQMLFSIGSTGGVNYQFSKDNPKNVGVAKVPQAAGHATKLIQQGPSLAFLKHPGENANNRGLGAWLFYKELTQIQSCIAWATTTGYSPIRKTVAESDDFLDFSDPDNFQAKTADRLKAINAAYQESTMDYLFTSPVFKGSSEARTQVGGLVTGAVGYKNELTDEVLNGLFKTAYDNTLLKM